MLRRFIRVEQSCLSNFAAAGLTRAKVLLSQRKVQLQKICDVGPSARLRLPWPPEVAKAFRLHTESPCKLHKHARLTSAALWAICIRDLIAAASHVSFVSESSAAANVPQLHVNKFKE